MHKKNMEIKSMDIHKSKYIRMPVKDMKTNMLMLAGAGAFAVFGIVNYLSVCGILGL